jgi:nicotinamidase-related amidase
VVRVGSGGEVTKSYLISIHNNSIQQILEKVLSLTLHPKSTALVIIDLQRAIVGRQLGPHNSKEVVSRSAELAAAVRASGGTVAYVHVLVNEFFRLQADKPNPRPEEPMPASASEVVEEAGFQPGDLLIAKRQWGAFYGTDLEQQLRRRGIRTIIMAGIATNFGVESTARAAQDHGYELVFAEDAMSSLSAELHEFSVQKLFPIMGRVRSSAEIRAALKGA